MNRARYGLKGLVVIGNNTTAFSAERIYPFSQGRRELVAATGKRLTFCFRIVPNLPMKNST